MYAQEGAFDIEINGAPEIIIEFFPLKIHMIMQKSAQKDSIKS